MTRRGLVAPFGQNVAFRRSASFFKENHLAKGEFVRPGRCLNSSPSAVLFIFLHAGERDEITTSEQAFGAENLVGIPKGRIEKKLVPGRTHRSFHGLAHAQGDVADDSAVANSFGSA